VIVCFHIYSSLCFLFICIPFLLFLSFELPFSLCFCVRDGAKGPRKTLPRVCLCLHKTRCSQSCYYSDCSLLSCDIVQSCRRILMFRRIILLHIEYRRLHCYRTSLRCVVFPSTIIIPLLPECLSRCSDRPRAGRPRNVGLISNRSTSSRPALGPSQPPVRSVKLITPHHPVEMSRVVELYFRSPIRLRGIALN
jgi:hypothetical protein